MGLGVDIDHLCYEKANPPRGGGAKLWVCMPLAQIAGLMNTVQSGVASAERLFELLDAPEEDRDRVPSASVSRVTGAISFKEVSFRYTPDQPLIEHFNLGVAPGETVAIVGATGAGKTTLVNLIMRFYEIESGQITLDGIDTRDITRDDFGHRQIFAKARCH